MGGGPDTAQQSTTTDIQRMRFGDLSPGLQGPLSGLFSQLGQATGGQAPPLPQGLLPPQLSGQQQGLIQQGQGFLGQPPALETQTNQALTNLLGGGISPFLQQAISAATDPIVRRYQQVIEPGIRDTAQRAGVVTGSKRAELERIGQQDLLDSLGRATAQTVVPLFESARQAQLGAVPFGQQQALAPFGRMQQSFQFGDMERQIEAQRRNVQLQEFLRQNPGLIQAGSLLGNLAGLEFGAPALSTTETTTGELGGGGGFMDFLGPALGIGGMLLGGPLGGMLGSGLGALGGNLFGGGQVGTTLNPTTQTMNF